MVDTITILKEINRTGDTHYLLDSTDALKLQDDAIADAIKAVAARDKCFSCSRQFKYPCSTHKEGPWRNCEYCYSGADMAEELRLKYEEFISSITKELGHAMHCQEDADNIIKYLRKKTLIEEPCSPEQG